MILLLKAFLIRFQSIISSLDEEIEVTEYFLTGNISPHEISCVLELSRQLLKAAKVFMNEEWIRKITFASHRRCALTGCPVYKTVIRARYWVSSKDHIVPQSQIRKGINESKNNKQNMCRIMNCAKGPRGDEWTRAWWRRFKEIKQKERES